MGFDPSLLEEAIANLSGSKTVVIKSTVLPGTTERLQARYPQHGLLFNPEFLREKSALQDFLEPDRQIVGFARRWDQAAARDVLQLLPRAPFEAVVPARRELINTPATPSWR
jgi:UDPglucose 6-dehydrogenase